MDRGLKASFRCSNHESTIEKRMHQLNWCRSWSFVYGFERFWFLCFWFKSLSNEFVYGFVGLQRLIFVVNLGIFTVFWKILGFLWFWTKTLRILYGSTSSGIRCCSWVWRGKFFWFSPGFIRRFDLNLQNSLVWLCFSLILLEIRK